MIRALPFLALLTLTACSDAELEAVATFEAALTGKPNPMQVRYEAVEPVTEAAIVVAVVEPEPEPEPAPVVEPEPVEPECVAVHRVRICP